MEEGQPLEQSSEQLNTHEFVPLQIWEKGRIEVTNTKYIERLTFRKLMSDIANAFNFEKGLLSTMLGLTIRPAKTICLYLDEGRYKVTSPVKYFLLIVGLTIFIGSMTDYYLLDKSEFLDDLAVENRVEMVKDSEGKVISRKISLTNNPQLLAFVNDAVIKYGNVFGLLSILVYSFFSFLFFRSSKFNFVEHLSINTYLYTHTSIWLLLLVIVGNNAPIFLIVQSVLFLIMLLIVYMKLFQGSKLKIALKGIGVYLLTSVFTTVITFIGMFLYLLQSGQLDEFFAAIPG